MLLKKRVPKFDANFFVFSESLTIHCGGEKNGVFFVFFGLAVA